VTTYRPCLLWNTDVSSSCTFSLRMICAAVVCSRSAFRESCGRYHRVLGGVSCAKEGRLKVVGREREKLEAGAGKGCAGGYCHFCGASAHR
jgi:hypothetical protein